jgi:hypothetical protein
MKKLIVLITVCIFSLNAMAQDAYANADSKPHGDKYCAKMMNGKMMVMYEGKEITSDVSLANGMQVTANGTLIKNDGSKVTLKNGECIDKDGNIVQRKEKEKMKEEKKSEY